MPPKKGSRKGKDTVIELPGGSLQTTFSIGCYLFDSDLIDLAKLLLVPTDPKPRTHKQTALAHQATVAHGV
jgi:hypothetical protein